MLPFPVKKLLPKSIAGITVLIFVMLVIIGLPSSSKFVSYRYVFSWSMYNGAWTHENYYLYFIGEISPKTFSREEVLAKYNVKILPYGLDPLKLFCEREVFLNSVERKGKFPATYKCMNNHGDSK